MFKQLLNLIMCATIISTPLLQAQQESNIQIKNEETLAVKQSSMTLKVQNAGKRVMHFAQQNKYEAIVFVATLALAAKTHAGLRDQHKSKFTNVLITGPFRMLNPQAVVLAFVGLFAEKRQDEGLYAVSKGLLYSIPAWISGLLLLNDVRKEIKK